MGDGRDLLERFFGAMSARDADAMAACYQPDATFEDIAFRLSGRDEIAAMWRMICASGVRVTYAVEDAGTARWTADYIFRDTGRPVRNEIRSAFTLRAGLIARQRDRCDALRWGVQALGPVGGLVTWLVPAVRRRKARRKLDGFIAGERAAR